MILHFHQENGSRRQRGCVAFSKEEHTIRPGTEQKNPPWEREGWVSDLDIQEWRLHWESECKALTEASSRCWELNYENERKKKIKSIEKDLRFSLKKKKTRSTMDVRGAENGSEKKKKRRHEGIGILHSRNSRKKKKKKKKKKRERKIRRESSTKQSSQNCWGLEEGVEGGGVARWRKCCQKF